MPRRRMKSSENYLVKLRTPQGPGEDAWRFLSSSALQESQTLSANAAPFPPLQVELVA